MTQEQNQASSTSLPKERPETIKLLKRIYAWASQNTSESRELGNFKYHWPSAVVKLLQTLELSQGSIIALVGLSGVGKSSAQVQVAKALNEKLLAEKPASASTETIRKVVHFKWPGYFDASYARILDFLKEQNVSTSSQEVLQDLAQRLAGKRDPRVLRRQLRELFGEEFAQRDFQKESLTKAELAKLLTDLDAGQGIDAEMLAKRVLGPSDLKEFQKELVISLLSDCHTILIDLRDYGLKDSRAMNTDLSEIQKLWQYVNEHLYSKKQSGKPGAPPNLVFVLQKELTLSSDLRVTNYFLGKAARIFEIEPFSPREMVDAFKAEFGSFEPFSEGQLETLARYSRGVFRRFLKYIQFCLDYEFQREREGKDFDFEGDVVEKALPEEEVLADWEMELRQIFPHGSYWRTAFHVVSAVSEYPKTQKELCEEIKVKNKKGIALNVGASDLSRIVTKLEEYGYVKRESSPEGKLVHLNI